MLAPSTIRGLGSLTVLLEELLPGATVDGVGSAACRNECIGLDAESHAISALQTFLGSSIHADSPADSLDLSKRVMGEALSNRRTVH